MFPKSNTKAITHRRKKRRIEIKLVIDEISNYLSKQTDANDKVNQILEFGSGYGFQIPYLERLGNVVASDIYTSNEIKKYQDIQFVQCGIDKTPFETEQFDLIFSNHVIEHIVNLKSAFAEMKRIGTSSCVYAFTVPTNIWMVLSIPAQYYNKIKDHLNFREKRIKKGENSISSSLTTKTKQIDDIVKKVKIKKFLLKGHGARTNFLECYRFFKISQWEKLFIANGFVVTKIQPLLLYGPSEWPIIPTMRSSKNLCSSVLFVLRKNDTLAQ